MSLKKEKLLSALSPHERFSSGYSGHGGYLLGLVIEIGRCKRGFRHDGSDVLDTIAAFDDAEIKGTYLGQVNMLTVSSFSGPQGLIWGYDILPSKGGPSVLTSTLQKKIPKLILRDGMEIRKATL